LRKAIEGGDVPDNISLVFDGWPKFKMKVNGTDWHGTVPTRVMGPVLEIQKDLYRAYANVCYGVPNLRRLKDDDRDSLELIVEVEKSSSDYEAPLWKQFNELAKKAIDKMSSRDVVITILGLAVVYGGVEVNKAWVAQRQDETQTEKTVELSKQETERLKVFASAMQQKPTLAEARTDFQASQNRILKTMKPGDKLETKGVVLKSSQASEITHDERARSKVMHISGNFRVLANDASKGVGFRIKVERVNDGLTFSADVPLELSTDEKELIQKAEWSKGAVLIHLDVNASKLRDSITNAVVFGAAAIAVK